MSDNSLEMAAPEQKKFSRPLLLFLVLMLLMGGGAGCYFFFMEEEIPPAPPKPAGARPKPGARVGAPRQSQAPAEKVPQVAEKVPEFMNLRTYTGLIGVREQLKIEKQIADLHKQIREAQKQQDKAPVAVQPVPEEKKKEEKKKTDDANTVKESKNETPGERLFAPKLLSVQGVNGRLTAIASDERGKIVSLSHGSPFLGGSVVAISRQEIVVDRKGSRFSLQFSIE
jgi:flagellar basal body-associated protein FliL